VSGTIFDLLDLQKPLIVCSSAPLVDSHRRC
jgi:UDP-N-acetylglucosamine transferase subunit ALG13